MAEARGASGESHVVVFRVGAELYGVDIRAVREVVPAGAYRITPVPRLPRFVRGVTNLRGRIVPVVDLRQRLGFGPAAVTGESRIAVVEGATGAVGLWVDAVSEVARFAPEQAEAPPEAGGEGEAGRRFVERVVQLGNRLIALLDLGQVLAREDRRAAMGVMRGGV